MLIIFLELSLQVDLNQNAKVNSEDLVIMIKLLGITVSFTESFADVNGDGIVNIKDLVK